MKGKETCNYLKVVRREVAAANGLELAIPECTYEGECQGTCPQCESEVRQLEQALSLRKSLSQKVSILGVAAGLRKGKRTLINSSVFSKYNSFDESVFIKGILLKGARSFHSLFRGITCGVLLYLPAVPRADTRGLPAPHVTASLRFASHGANILYPYGVGH